MGYAALVSMLGNVGVCHLSYDPRIGSRRLRSLLGHTCNDQTRGSLAVGRDTQAAIERYKTSGFRTIGPAVIRTSNAISDAMTLCSSPTSQAEKGALTGTVTVPGDPERRGIGMACDSRAPVRINITNDINSYARSREV